MWSLGLGHCGEGCTMHRSDLERVPADMTWG